LLGYPTSTANSLLQFEDDPDIQGGSFSQRARQADKI
jgi:hypothetical protein